MCYAIYEPLSDDKKFGIFFLTLWSWLFTHVFPTISSLMMLLTFASSTQSLLQYKAHKQILKKQWEEDTE